METATSLNGCSIQPSHPGRVKSEGSAMVTKGLVPTEEVFLMGRAPPRPGASPPPADPRSHGGG